MKKKTKDTFTVDDYLDSTGSALFRFIDKHNITPRALFHESITSMSSIYGALGDLYTPKPKVRCSIVMALERLTGRHVSHGDVFPHADEPTNLAYIVVSLGLQSKEVARLCGMDKGHINQYFHYIPTRKKAERFSKGLGVSVEEVMSPYRIKKQETPAEAEAS